LLLAAKHANVRIAALDGAFNMAHPDAEARNAGLRGIERVIEAAAHIGTRYVTLCTGTRERSSMWRRHPDNESDLAWNDARDTIVRALEMAAPRRVTLLVEPEPANIACSAAAARRLLDEIGSSNLKIVLDPANMVLSERSRDPETVLAEGFEMLGRDIEFAHAKDLSTDGEFCAAGTGIVPWDSYWSMLRGIGYDGDVIFHTLSEADVPRALEVFRPAL
jgi:sugar phosphate isomerase/epimerase